MEWTVEQGRICSRDESGEVIAEATFHEKANGDYDIDHTYVVPQLRGRGVADDMMTAVAEHFRNNKNRVTASCSYANAWFKTHRAEYADIISNELENETPACRIPR